VKFSLLLLAFVPPRKPPDFSTIPSERAIKHTYKLNTGLWSKEEIKVKIDKTPFAKGTLRLAYHMTGLVVPLYVCVCVYMCMDMYVYVCMYVCKVCM